MFCLPVQGSSTNEKKNCFKFKQFHLRVKYSSTKLTDATKSLNVKIDPLMES